MVVQVGVGVLLVLPVGLGLFLLTSLVVIAFPAIHFRGLLRCVYEIVLFLSQHLNF
jgi:hypothetical protein